MISMRLAATVLGLAGAIAGFLGSVLFVAVGGVAAVFDLAILDVSVAGFVAIGVAIGIFCSFIAFVGAGVALLMPRLGALIMTFAAICGTLATALAFLPGGVLLIVASVTAWRGRSRPVRDAVV